jgi:hypothetical protein
VRGINEEQVKIVVIKSRDWELVEEKVKSGMTVVDIGTVDDLKKMVAALPEFATRASLSSVLELTGFNAIYPSDSKYVSNNLTRKPETGTAIVKGRNYHDVKLDLQIGLAAATKVQSIPEKEYTDLRDKILEYPSFVRGFRAMPHAIATYIRKRDTKITEPKVKSVLKRMAAESLLVQTTDKKGSIVYTSRKCDHGERGETPIPGAGSPGSQLPAQENTASLPLCTGICAKGIPEVSS